MDPYAEMTCVLKVNTRCDACKRKVMEVLQNIHGVYSITIDADHGTVRVCGKVNPMILLRVLERSGKHAEVSSVRFDGEVNNNVYYYGENPLVGGLEYRGLPPLPPLALPPPTYPPPPPLPLMPPLPQARYFPQPPPPGAESRCCQM